MFLFYIADGYYVFLQGSHKVFAFTQIIEIVSTVISWISLGTTVFSIFQANNFPVSHYWPIKLTSVFPVSFIFQRFSDTFYRFISNGVSGAENILLLRPHIIHTNHHVSEWTIAIPSGLRGETVHPVGQTCGVVQSILRTQITEVCFRYSAVILLWRVSAYSSCLARNTRTHVEHTSSTTPSVTRKRGPNCLLVYLFAHDSVDVTVVLLTFWIGMLLLLLHFQLFQPERRLFSILKCLTLWR